MIRNKLGTTEEYVGEYIPT